MYIYFVQLALTVRGLFSFLIKPGFNDQVAGGGIADVHRFVNRSTERTQKLRALYFPSNPPVHGIFPCFAA